MRGLDGEKKALVYDNYSRLIAATDTIRRVSGVFSFPLSTLFIEDAYKYATADTVITCAAWNMKL